jgi:hypothetical protein
MFVVLRLWECPYLPDAATLRGRLQDSALRCQAHSSIRPSQQNQPTREASTEVPVCHFFHRHVTGRWRGRGRWRTAYTEQRHTHAYVVGTALHACILHIERVCPFAPACIHARFCLAHVLFTHRMRKQLSTKGSLYSASNLCFTVG